MKRSLRSLMSIILALSICIACGTIQTFAQEEKGAAVTSAPVVVNTRSLSDSTGADYLGNSDEKVEKGIGVTSVADDDIGITSKTDESVPNAEPSSTSSPATSPETSPESGHSTVRAEAHALEVQAEGTDASAFFHPTITTENESIANGQYAAFNVRYTIDRGKISAGDFVMVTVSEALRDVSLSVSSQIFAEKIDLGNGQYKLVFNENAVNGISGSFSISAFGNNDSDSSTTATVTVGDVSKTITVGAGSHGGGVGPETRGIIKWGYEGEGYTQDTASSGVFDQDRDVTITYAIEVDPRMSVMTGVTVSDELPPEMRLDPSSIRIVTEYQDGQTGPELSKDEVAQIASVSGNALTFDFGDMLDGTKFYRIYYDATVPAGTNTKITNRATVNYEGQNGPDTETSQFTIKPMSGYNSSLGYKSVDKAEVGSDVDDQIVTYTIVFENDQPFEAGEISLTDRLDDRVAYVDSYGTEYFDLTYDSETRSVTIVNTTAIPASSRQEVTIVTDFSNVPIGTTIENTVGGNTTRTKKVGGALLLTALKTIDGHAPEGRSFSIELLGPDGSVAQTKTNDADGTVAFDPISFGRQDVGKTYTYKVRESSTQDETGFVLDPSVYTVTVSPVDEDDDGILECTPLITKEGVSVASIAFNNTSETISIPVSKRWVGPAGGSVTVRLLADGADTGRSIELTADGGWEGSFEGLAKYRDRGVAIEYSVAEDGVEGYAAEVAGDAESGFTITNTFTKTEMPVARKDGRRTSEKPRSITPQTGDGSGSLIRASLLVGLASAGCGILSRAIRKNRQGRDVS